MHLLPQDNANELLDDLFSLFVLPYQKKIGEDVEKYNVIHKKEQLWDLLHSGKGCQDFYEDYY